MEDPQAANVKNGFRLRSVQIIRMGNVSDVTNRGFFQTFLVHRKQSAALSSVRMTLITSNNYLSENT